MKTVWIVEEVGYDYDHSKILAICTSNVQADTLLEATNVFDPMLFPWNGRRRREVELDRLLSEQEIMGDVCP
jgi:hypothetical protein